MLGALILAAGPVTGVAAARATATNWAGYVASAPGASFTRVSATWIQPAVSCTTASTKMSSWIGLGGDQTGTLEQIGTEADCVDGSATYSSWYELVPSMSGDPRLAIRAGDLVSASVTVTGHDVRLALNNETLHASFSRRLQARLIDVTTAEWIIEAPQLCFTSLTCQQTALADFGSTGFSRARATSSGHTGTIGDAHWSATSSTLGRGSAGAGAHPYATSARSGSLTESVTPSRLERTGDAFSVRFRASSTATALG